MITAMAMLQDDTATSSGRQGPSSSPAGLSHCQDACAIAGRNRGSDVLVSHPRVRPVQGASTLRISRPVKGPSTWSSWLEPWRSRCAGRSRRRAGACAAWPASPAWSPTTNRAWATRTAWTCPRRRPSRTWWPTSRLSWRRPGCATRSFSAPTTAGPWPRSTPAATRCANWCFATRGPASSAATTSRSECPATSSTSWPSAYPTNGVVARSRTSTPPGASPAREARSNWHRPATTKSIILPPQPHL